MQSFRHLRIWQRSHRLAVEINRLTRQLPAYERFGLGAQLRDSASSVPFIIAEGCGRKVANRDNVELLRFVTISSGSRHELDSELEYTRDVEYLPPSVVDPYLGEVEEIRRMLGMLRLDHAR